MLKFRYGDRRHVDLPWAIDHVVFMFRCRTQPRPGRARPTASDADRRTARDRNRLRLLAAQTVPRDVPVREHDAKYALTVIASGLNRGGHDYRDGALRLRRSTVAARVRARCVGWSLGPRDCGRD